MTLAELFGFPSLDQFLNQPLDVVINQLIIQFGWLPLLWVLMMGVFTTWLEVQKRYWKAHRPYILLAIDVPRATEQSPKAVENIFAVAVALKAGPTWLETYIMGKVQWRHSFEVTSINGYIQFYIWTEQRYRDAFEAAIYAQYPDAEIALVDDYTHHTPHHFPNDEYDAWGGEYTLSREHFYPIRTWMDFEHSMSQELKDPLAMLFEGFAKLRPGEQMWFQIVTDYAGEDWKREGDAFIQKTYGVGAKGAHGGGLVSQLGSAALAIPEMFVGNILGTAESHEVEKDKFKEDMWKAFKVTEQEREVSKAVVRKIAKPGLRCKIRIMYVAKKEVFTKVTRKDFLKGLFKQLAHQDLNSFKTYGTPEDDYFWQHWWYYYYVNRAFKGYMKRDMYIGTVPSVLNIEELATIWHFPTINMKVPLIKKTLAKRAEPPAQVPFATEEEEFLVAPVPVGVPVASGHEDAHVSMAPELPSLPPIVPSAPVRPKVPDARAPHVATKWQEPHSGEPAAPETPRVVPPSVSAKPQAKSHPTTSRIPDGIRVLIEQGVEPEDVGIQPEDHLEV